MGQWGYFKMKTVTLWCLIDIPILIFQNFSSQDILIQILFKFYSKSYSISPAIKFWEKLHFPHPPPADQVLWIFQGAPIIHTPLLLGTKKHCMFSYTVLAFFFQPVYSNLPANQIFGIFPSLPNMQTPLILGTKEYCFHLALFLFFIIKLVFSVFSFLYETPTTQY